MLDLSIDYYQQFKRAGDQLATERFTEAQLRRVLDELYPSGTDDTASDRTRRSREQTKQRITDLFVHGNTLGNAPGTKWAAVNAIIEHADSPQSDVMRSRSVVPRARGSAVCWTSDNRVWPNGASGGRPRSIPRRSVGAWGAVGRGSGSSACGCRRRQMAMISWSVVTSMFVTVAVTPSISVSKGTARCSSIIVNRPVICS